MIIDRYLAQAARQAAAPQTGAALSRRQFVTMTMGGAVGLALMPLATPEVQAQNAPSLPPGQKPTEQPAAFVSIARDGTTTVLCNRMDMGQGIETALAMICAEELDADWSKVKVEHAPAAAVYANPAMGMQMTGGSTSTCSWSGAACRRARMY